MFFSFLTDPRKAQSSFALYFSFTLSFFNSTYVHTNNANCTAVLSLSATAALLLSATSLDTDVSPLLRSTGEITVLYYKSHRVNTYQWVWNSTYQTTNSGYLKARKEKWEREKEGKGTVIFF